MRTLFDKIAHYGASDILPMHMPGHKRQAGFMRGVAKFDITEVTGFDDLHHPEGILREAMEEAAVLWESDESFFLINGSTCGILSAITAATRFGNKILLARNCHKSALNAVTLQQLDPVWLYPKKITPFAIDGGIDPAEVEEALEKQTDIAAVLIVSPTYEGVVSDVRSIAEAAHRHNIPLIVDAAHGAHFRFGKTFPADALSQGADIVVESLHKTLPALTQTAILHVNSDLIDKDSLRFALQTFESSSPSYLLMASAVECVRIMKEQGPALMEEYDRHLSTLRRSLAHLSEGLLLEKTGEMFDYDNGKIVLGFHGYNGGEIHRYLLERYRVEIEMAAPGYIVAMTSVYDNDEALFRFQAALNHLRRELPLRGKQDFPSVVCGKAEKVLKPSETRYRPKETCPLKEAEGKIAAETLYLYPPGSPLIATGERFTKEIIQTVRRCEEQGCTVYGTVHNTVKILP